MKLLCLVTILLKQQASILQVTSYCLGNNEVDCNFKIASKNHNSFQFVNNLDITIPPNISKVWNLEIIKNFHISPTYHHCVTNAKL